MNPLLTTFVRLTILIAGVLVAIFLAFFILKIVVFAAIVAAIVLGGLFLYNRFFRRGVPAGR